MQYDESAARTKETKWVCDHVFVAAHQRFAKSANNDFVRMPMHRSS